MTVETPLYVLFAIVIVAAFWLRDWTEAKDVAEGAPVFGCGRTSGNNS